VVATGAATTGAAVSGAVFLESDFLEATETGALIILLAVEEFMAGIRITGNDSKSILGLTLHFCRDPKFF
jgi:hypothetical protein